MRRWKTKQSTAFQSSSTQVVPLSHERNFVRRFPATTLSNWTGSTAKGEDKRHLLYGDYLGDIEPQPMDFFLRVEPCSMNSLKSPACRTITRMSVGGRVVNWIS